MTHSIAPEAVEQHIQALGPVTEKQKELTGQVSAELETLKQALDAVVTESKSSSKAELRKAIEAIVQKAQKDADLVVTRITNLQTEVQRDGAFSERGAKVSKSKFGGVANKVALLISGFQQKLQEITQNIPGVSDDGIPDVSFGGDVEIDAAEIIESEKISSTKKPIHGIRPPLPRRPFSTTKEVMSTTSSSASEHATQTSMTEMVTNGPDGNSDLFADLPPVVDTETADGSTGPDSTPPPSIAPPEGTEGRVTIIPDAMEDRDVVSHRETLPPPPMHATETAHDGDEYELGPIPDNVKPTESYTLDEADVRNAAKNPEKPYVMDTPSATSRTETLPPPAPDMIEGMAKDGEGLELVAQELGTAFSDGWSAEDQELEVPLPEGDLQRVQEMLAWHDEASIAARVAELEDSRKFLRDSARQAKQQLNKRDGEGVASGDLMYPTASVLELFELQSDVQNKQIAAYNALEGVRTVSAVRQKLVDAMSVYPSPRRLTDVYTKEEMSLLIDKRMIEAGATMKQAMPQLDQQLTAAHDLYTKKLQEAQTAEKELTQERERVRNEVTLHMNEYRRNADSTLNQYKNALVFDVDGENVSVSAEGKNSQYAKEYEDQAAYATEYIRYNRSLEQYGKPFEDWAVGAFTALMFAGARGLSTEEKAALTKSREGLVRQDRSFAMHSHVAARKLNELNKASTRSYGASPYHVERIKAAPNRVSGKADTNTFRGMLKNTLSGGGLKSIWSWMKGGD